MKIIDILNKMANGTLEDGFKFCFEDEVYTYTKHDDAIRDINFYKLGKRKVIEEYLNEEVLLFKDNNQEIKEIEELTDDDMYDFNHLGLKINEIAREVNKIKKEMEEK